MIEELFLKNEEDSNSAIAVFLIFISTSVGILACTLTVKYFYLVGKIGTITTAITCVIVILISIFAKINKSKPYIKYILMLSVIVLSSVLYFFYTNATTFIVYGAILLSVKYYDTKFVKKVAVTSWLFLMLTIILNVVLDKYSPKMTSYHKMQEIYYWSRYKNVFFYIIIPKTSIMIITYAIGYWIADSGKKLVFEQANITTQALNLQTELNTALTIQKETLPDAHAEFFGGDISINAFWKPARDLGGDFYDYRLRGQNVAFVIADVSDKGLPAAMFAMRIQSALGYVLINSEDMDEAVKKINDYLLFDCKSEMFVTMWIGIIDYRSGIGRYINAGHNMPLIKHKNGEVEYIKNEPDLFFGMIEDANQKVHTLELQEGDTLILYTDGLTDALNTKGESFGDDRLYKEVKENDNVFQGLTTSLEKYTENAQQFDDVTLMEVIFNNFNIQYKEGTIELVVNKEMSKIAIDSINKILQEEKCPINAVRKIDIIIDEVCSNIYEYAYEQKEEKFVINYKLYSNCIKLKFIDYGKAFDPTNKEAPIIDEGNPKIGGFGIYFIKNLANDVNYTYEDNKNILEIVKIWKPNNWL